MRISKCFIIALLTFVMSLAQAQKPKHFDPERFQRDLEQFIATQACLSPAESAEFSPFIVRCATSNGRILQPSVACVILIQATIRRVLRLSVSAMRAIWS